MLPLQRSCVLSPVPDWGTNIPHAVLCGHKKKKKERREHRCFLLQSKRQLKDMAVSVAGNRNHRKKMPLWNAMVLTLKSIRTSIHSKITLKNLKKFGRFTLSNFKTYYKVIKCILINTGCYLQKDKHIDQQNGRNGWEVYSHRYRQLILD